MTDCAPKIAVDQFIGSLLNIASDYYNITEDKDVTNNILTLAQKVNSRGRSDGNNTNIGTNNNKIQQLRIQLQIKNQQSENQQSKK